MNTPDIKTNIKHANNPQVGDYWQEMLQPILLVLKTNKRKKEVTFVQEKVELDTNYWTWDLEKPEVLSFKEFKDKLIYTTDSENTWCDVWPNADRHQDFIKEFKKLERKKNKK